MKKTLLSLLGMLILITNTANAQKIIEENNNLFFIRIENISLLNQSTGKKTKATFEISYFGHFELIIHPKNYKNCIPYAYSDSTIVLNLDTKESLDIKFSKFNINPNKLIQSFIDTLVAQKLCNHKIISLTFLPFKDSINTKTKPNSNAFNNINIQIDKSSRENIEKSFALLVEWLTKRKQYNLGKLNTELIEKFKKEHFIHFTEKQIKKNQW